MTAKRRILIVDDVPIIREPMALVLESLGYRPLQAASSREAISALESAVAPVDLILLDYSMPGMSGTALLELMRRTPAWRDIPVVMLTDAASRDVVLKAAHLGVRRYLLKTSFSVEELSHAIEAELRDSGAERRPRPEGTASTERTVSQGTYRNDPATRLYVGRTGTLQAVDDFARANARSAGEDRLLDAICAQGTTPARLAAAIAGEPAISARILWIANTAAFPVGGGPVVRIDEAVARIGFTAARLLAAAAVLRVGKEATSIGRAEVEAGQRALAHAMSLERLLGPTVNPGMGYLVGLAHGLVHLVLGRSFPAAVEAAVRRAEATGQPIEEAREKVFGATRLELLARLLRGVVTSDTVTGRIEELFRAGSIEDPAGRIGGALRISDSYWSSLLLGAGDLAPVSRDDLARVDSEPGLPPVDLAALRHEVIRMSMALAQPRPEEAERLVNPARACYACRVWYARHPDFSEPDPLRHALSALAEVELSERIPERDEECEQLGALVVAWCDRSLTAGVSEVVMRCAVRGRHLPTLYLSPEAASGAGASGACYPIPIGRLDRFLATCASVK
jgi:CheY-like chemotaxis protein